MRQAAQHGKSLDVSRKKLAAALKLLQRSDTGDDFAALPASLYAHLPRSMEIGKYKSGVLTPRQKQDLFAWLQVRERQGHSLTRAELLCVMTKMIMFNQSEAWPDAWDDYEQFGNCAAAKKALQKYDTERVPHTSHQLKIYISF